MTKTAVLAFSGGLDTTYCAAWLREAGYAVHSGGRADRRVRRRGAAAIERRARAAGVAEHVAIDARDELFNDYLRYLIFANALRGGVYPLVRFGRAGGPGQARGPICRLGRGRRDGARLDRRGQRSGPLRHGLSRPGARRDNSGADPPAGDLARGRDRLACRARHRRPAENQQVFGQSRPVGRDDRRRRDAQQRRRVAGGGISVDAAAGAAARPSRRTCGSTSSAACRCGWTARRWSRWR